MCTAATLGIASSGDDNQAGPSIPKMARNWFSAPRPGSKIQVQTRPIATGVAIHGITSSARKYFIPRSLRLTSRASSSDRIVVPGTQIRT